MQHLNPAADLAGARSPRARNQDAPAFPPVARRALLPAVRTIRHELGLSTGDLLVLDALLSFLPCRDRKTGEDRPITPDLMLVVFASNAALAERANGMEERVLRRHVARLCEAGLLRRKDSATGKRFPLKAEGVIRDAFGLDLTPLLERHPELTRRAEAARQREEELRSVRAEALALRARALAMRDRIGEEAAGYLETVKTILRRATITIEQVRDLMGRISAILSGAPCPACPRAKEETIGASRPKAVTPAPLTTENTPAPAVTDERPPMSFTGTTTDPQRDPSPVEHHREGTGSACGAETEEMSAGDGRNVRRVESPKMENKNRGAPPRALDPWAGCHEIAAFYPEPPRSETDLIRIIYDLGRMMNISDRPLIGALLRLGPVRMLQALDYLARNVARITRPQGYLDRMVADYEAGKPVGWAR
ncbi:replication initiation protein RepC [Gemmobacter caeni]|uniref:Replication initiation protein RepC n=1 Tax=Gemmobacter caeni TaxID=589035 RepID=A0A2T6B8R1_9RHOB|nr:helix-turn-helix domain-containing protein [Gemmobacter caeni]PTX52446.1 replication initiation protein RepC [Gemmobacter caeni]TWJ02883.1 replication initiation protein RepC [Gemmobacter caeni]